MGKEEKKKMEQKDELTNSGQRFPVEQVSNTGKPTKKQVKAAVKELNPDVNSLGSSTERIWTASCGMAESGVWAIGSAGFAPLWRIP